MNAQISFQYWHTVRTGGEARRHARFRTQTRARTTAPHHRRSSPDPLRVSPLITAFFLVALALSGYATLFKANNGKARGLLNHRSHFKDACRRDIFDLEKAET